MSKCRRCASLLVKACKSGDESAGQHGLGCSSHSVGGCPKDKSALDNLALRKRPPRLRFSLGEGYTVEPNGADEYLGEVLHTYVD